MEILNIKGISSFKTCCVMCILISFLPNTRTLYITNMAVPSFVDVRDIATLSCSYNLGNQKLNSVKWYKNDKEFYRYSPLMPNNERQRIFSVDGVHVGNDYFCNNKTCTIHLDNLSSETTGHYRCEVSGDAPDFKLVHDGNNLTVVAIPQTKPKIEGIEENYFKGDFLFGNCTSDFSYPPPIMSWYINDQKADAIYLQPYHEQVVAAYGLNLTQRSLEIRLHIDKRIDSLVSRSGKVSMKCISQIRQMPTLIREAEHTFAVQPVFETHLKLINWKNSASALRLSQSNQILFLLPHLITILFLNYAISIRTVYRS